MNNAGVAALLATALLLTGLVGLELWQPKPAALPETAPARRTPTANLPGAAPDPGASTDILARPLFEPNRRPANRTAAASNPKTTSTLPRLAGIVMDGNRRSAIFAPQGDGRPITLEEGGQLDGYRIETITARQVTISGPGIRQTLKLSFDPTPPKIEQTIPIPTVVRPVFNGPPGLANMPRIIQSPNSDQPGLGGIPGLSPPARP